MGRLIDADALLKKFAHPPELMYTNVVMDEIRSAPTVGGWISVEDRLPEVGKVVLAFGTRSATTGMFQGVSIRNDLWFWKGNTIKHVSHWMPLPEAPKEENDNEDD